MQNFRAICFLITMLITVLVERSFADTFQIDKWTVEQGLPDSSVKAIAQAPDGNLWAGTYNGLARFDGINFVIFDPENTPALAPARARQIKTSDVKPLSLDNCWAVKIPMIKSQTKQLQTAALKAQD